MYYGKKKNNFFGTFIIILFLIFIIIILFSLMSKLDINYLVISEETKETGTDSIVSEFSIEDLMKNSIYSVVRNFKIK